MNNSEITIFASIVAGIFLGILSNWLYDLLKKKDILPANPTIKRGLFVAISFSPLIFLVALPQLLQKQSFYEYTGKVIDSATKEPVYQASVTLFIQGTNPTYITDSIGQYRFSVSFDSQKIPVLIKVKASGYMDYDLYTFLTGDSLILETIELVPYESQPLPISTQEITQQIEPTITDTPEMILPTLTPIITPTALDSDLLFQDDFNNLSLGDWHISGGRADIENNSLVLTGGQSPIFIFNGGDSWENYLVRARMMIPVAQRASNFGVFVRGNYDCQLYYVQFFTDDDAVWLVRYNGGGCNADMSFDWISHTWYEFKEGIWHDIEFLVKNSTLTVSINGTNVIQGTDNEFSAGKFGFRVGNAQVIIDNVEVFRVP